MNWLIVKELASAALWAAGSIYIVDEVGGWWMLASIPLTGLMAVSIHNALTAFEAAREWRRSERMLASRYAMSARAIERLRRN